MRRQRVLLGVLLALCVLALGVFGWGWFAGAKPERASVSGSVTYNGKPVQEGAIFFRPLEGSGVAGGDIQNSFFEIDKETGPGIGKHRIGVTSFDTTDEGRPVIPVEFFQNPTYQVEIKPGHNDLDIELRLHE